MQEVSIVGGGFYGCFLGLYFQSKGNKVTIYEKDVDILLGCSNINQYKVHNGYHYPRDEKTRITSRKNYTRFIHDFSEAIYRDFIQYYAIASGSAVSSQAYYDMFKNTNLIQDCTNLFPHEVHKLESIFRVDEFSFNSHTLRDLIKIRLKSSGVTVKTNTRIVDPEKLPGKVYICVYDASSQFSKVEFFKKRTEMLYFSVGKEFKHIGLTVVDGPFFSFTPAPGRNSHVLSCVHLGVHDKSTNAPDIVEYVSTFLPFIKTCAYIGNSFTTRAYVASTMPTDGRPILIEKLNDKVTLILGSKIDNVYDMIEELEGVQSNRYILSNT